jgi:glycosyltransferase involved in cell wall biosynthesis
MAIVQRKSDISVIIRTYNEEKNIRACLESASWANEIVVVDSESKDNTVAIVKEYTDRVVTQPWLGHIGQSQFATDQAANLWVLSLDADEVISPGLRDEILELDLNSTGFDAFEMPRLHFFMQKWIRHSAWYPDYKIRLFRKDKCRWGGVAPHDKVQVPGRTGRLKGDILHYIYYDLEHFAGTKNKYSSLTAFDHFRNGKRAGFIDFTLRPVYAFLYRYLVRMGFLDGLPGFAISVMESHAVFMKYMKLYELQRNLKRFSKTGDSNRLPN